MTSKFAEKAPEASVPLNRQSARELIKPSDAQRVAQLVAQDVKEILAAKQKQVQGQD